MVRSSLAALVGFGAMLLVGAPLGASAQDVVVVPTQRQATAPPAARFARAVDVDVEGLAAAMEAGRDVVVNVGPLQVTVSPERIDRRGAGRFTLFGAVDGGGRATLTVEAPFVYARITHAGGVLVIEPSANGHIAYAPAPIDGEGDDALPAPRGSPSAIGGGDELFPDELHIALFFTGQVADSLGEGTGVFMQATVDQITDVLANSNVDFSARLVHTSEVDHVETTQLSGNLFALQDPSDGDMDEVHEIRDAVSADMVALLVETGTNSATGCGVAFLMSSLDPGFESAAFSVTKRRCAPDLVFAHEVGHNLGLHHDILVAPGPGLFDYSHGFVNIDSMNIPPGRPGIRTPLAYHQACQNAGGECVRIPYYSTPEQLYNGQVIGDAATADNTRTVRQSAPLTATFRAPLRLTTEAGSTVGAPTWHRPSCADPSDPASCVLSDQVTAVPFLATPFQVTRAGRHYLRSTSGFEGVLVLYADAFDPGQPLVGIAGYSEPDPSAPASRRLLLSADLEAGRPYVLVTTGLTNADAGAFENAFFGPVGGGIVVAADDAPAASAFTLVVSPNPARGTASVDLSVADGQRVVVDVIDQLGRRVASVYDGVVAAGRMAVLVPVSRLAPGSYAVRAAGERATRVARLTVIR